MTIDVEDFRVPPCEDFRLSDRSTSIKHLYKSKHHYKNTLANQVDELSDLQRMHYASSRHALLIIFQGMDAAGKDGVIRNVMSGVNPQGCEVHSFKQPSAEELQHDFLWRTTCRLPERGRIGIFNRSYYEDVLITRVHPEILVGAEATRHASNEKVFWEERYQSIVDLEAHLERNSTRVIKIFLHLSREEQRKRFLDRIDEAEKNWKFSVADIREREYWDQYAQAFEACLDATSSSTAPWFVVPADDKHDARLIVSQIVMGALESLKMSYPEVTAKRKEELKDIRKLLVK